MSSIFETLETTVGRSVRRDISRIAAFAKGNLERAARSIAEHPAPHVGITCGFFVRHGEPPSPETDGLNGMGQLACGLVEAGIPVTVISDAPCAKAVWAVTTVVPAKVNLEIVSVDDAAVRRLRHNLETAEHPHHPSGRDRALLRSVGRQATSQSTGGTSPPTRLPSISCSRIRTGRPRGRPSASAMAATRSGSGRPAEGDRREGHSERRADRSPDGVRLPARRRRVARIGGAYGLLAALAVLRPDLKPALLKHFNGQMEHDILAAPRSILDRPLTIAGSTGPANLQMSIDRLPLALTHVALIEGTCVDRERRVTASTQHHFREIKIDEQRS